MIAFLFIFFSAINPHQSQIEEMRVAFMDMQQTVRSQAIEIQILTEEIQKLKTTKNFENRIQKLEASLDKITCDLKEIINHANMSAESLQTLHKELSHQKEKLAEVSKLKTTLQSISKAMGTGKIHKVQPGDTLEKIARQYNTTIEALKLANGLASDVIIKDQDLKIP